MKFDPNLPPKHREALRQTRLGRIVVYEGAVRSGKTITSLLAFMDHIVSGPEGGLMMVGRTSDTLRRNVIDPMIELFGTDIVKPTYGAGILRVAGRTVHLVGADNQAAVTRIQGMTLVGAYVDEVAILGGPGGQEFWNMLLSRLSLPGAKLIGTTNPASPAHWLLEYFLQHAEVEITRESTLRRHNDEHTIRGLHRYRFTIDDNPTLSKEYVDSVKDYYRKQPLFYRRMIEGSWVAATGSVYSLLDKETHLLSDSVWRESVQKPHGKVVFGVDHGTTNPTHVVRVGVDDEGERLVVDGELRLTEAHLTIAQQAEKVLAWVESLGHSRRHAVFIIDPAAKAFRNELAAQTGKYPLEAVNEVLPGIADVGTLLGAEPPGIVFYNTPELFKELSGYMWDRKKTETGADAPQKKADHGADALRYAVHHPTMRTVWARWRRFRPPPRGPVDRALRRR